MPYDVDPEVLSSQVAAIPQVENQRRTTALGPNENGDLEFDHLFSPVFDVFVWINQAATLTISVAISAADTYRQFGDPVEIAANTLYFQTGLRLPGIRARFRLSSTAQANTVEFQVISRSLP